MELCKCGKETYSEGLCKTCYIKEWTKKKYHEAYLRTKNDPDRYNRRLKKQVEINKRYKENHPDRIKSTHKKYYETHKEQVLLASNERSKRYYKKHKEQILERQKMHREVIPEIKNKDVCDILKKHHKDLKDDPERLSTEFLQRLIGVKCDK